MENSEHTLRETVVGRAEGATNKQALCHVESCHNFSLELFIARSQAFRHLDEVNEERIEEEFIANRRNDLELIQDSIRVIEDEVRINVAISLFLQTVKKNL